MLQFKLDGWQATAKKPQRQAVFRTRSDSKDRKQLKVTEARAASGRCCVRGSCCHVGFHGRRRRGGGAQGRGARAVRRLACQDAAASEPPGATRRQGRRAHPLAGGSDRSLEATARAWSGDVCGPGAPTSEAAVAATETAGQRFLKQGENSRVFGNQKTTSCLIPGSKKK